MVRIRQRPLVLAVAPLAAALAAMLSAPARADVLVVDVSGAGDFTALQPAITAAAEGDTILVRPPGPGFGFWTVSG